MVFKDPSTKAVAMCKCRKLSHQAAVQDAFSKLLLVVLDNGKVYPEINTTVEEHLQMDPELETDGLLKVLSNINLCEVLGRFVLKSKPTRLYTASVW